MSAAASRARVGPADRGRLRAVPWLPELGVRYSAGVAALAGLYYLSAKIGFALEFAGPVAAVIWLPAGVGIAFLCIGGLGFWPGVLLGDLLVNDYGALPLGTALGQTGGNMLEVLVAAWLIRRSMRRGAPLSGIGGLSRVLLAVAAGTALSATVGAITLLLGDVVSAGELPTVWRTWWLGDFSGGLVVVPFALAWARPAEGSPRAGRALEAGLLIVTIATVSGLALRGEQPVTYLVFPPLIWAALRFGQRGAGVAVAITIGVTVSNSRHLIGPFHFDLITNDVLNTQLFILVTALSTWCLATVVSEREELAARLALSRTRLIDTADMERRRIEHNLHDGAQQRLTALLVRLGLVSHSSEGSPDRAAAALDDARSELSLAIDELRELAHGIHPRVLTEAGLAAAMKLVAARSPVPVELVAVPPMRLDGAAEATAYYVFAEAVTNAQKHARAPVIRVRARAEGGYLYVEVEDGGVGGAAASPGSGLGGLRDRVEVIGGSFEVVSHPGQGTRVAAAIPATAVP